MSSLTRERLKELLHYEPTTGVFTNILPRGNLAAGDQLGWENGKGYKRVGVDGERYLAHCLAYLYMAGHLPNGTIDHIDGDTSNNKWENLRVATSAQNTYNKGCYKNNRLGVKGVNKTKSGSYMVRVNHKSYGCYEDIELAEFIAKEIRETLHGEFARHV